jgi:hypothetical protein
MKHLPSTRFALTLVATAAAACSLAAQAQVTPTDSVATPGGVEPVTGPDIGGGIPVRTAQAQAPSETRAYAGEDAYSLLPYTRRGYFGINLGRPRFHAACGSGVYACDDPNVGVSIYTGGLFNDWVGMELGYVNTGEADRAGGDTRAQGVNLSVVLRAPLGSFNVFAKGGAIYGQTRVSSGPLSDVSAGKRRGWGASYGGGVGFDFTPSSGVVLEWSRNEFLFPGNGGRQDVDTTALGYVHRF